MDGEKLTKLICALGRILIPRGWKVASAESCTGGMIASSIVGNTEVSSVFERGFVVYSVDAKCELLGLDRKRVSECDGVAPDIAEAMARAALSHSRAEFAVATTGFAGPQETDEEVGLVYIAAGSRQGVRSITLRLGDIGREAVSRRAVEAALQLLLEVARELAGNAHGLRLASKGIIHES